MKYKINAFFIIPGTLFLIQSTFAQNLTSKIYPKDYFQWPLGLSPSMSANYGELRPNHFHMGIDCRTEQKQNQKVLAAAEGYIARVKIEPFGFGRCIYINHPNGLTTVYAHLNDFIPELEKYITATQYRLKSWRVNVEIPSGLFPVIKGQFIGYSGNTGGSQGPHLHFEIRDTKSEKVLNPQLFGLAVKDNVAPDITRLALYDRNISTYEQTPKMLALKKVNGIYSVSPSLIIVNTGKVSFSIGAVDRSSGSGNPNGIYEAVLYDNEKVVIGFQLNNIGYDETRYLNAHIDYKMRSSGGPYLQHLSKLPGYNYGVYEMKAGDGVINLEDDQTHAVKIEVKDADGNISIIKLEVKRGTLLTPQSQNGGSPVNIHNTFYPGYINVFENSNISCELSENFLYDTIRFQYKEINSQSLFPIYQLHNASVPVHGYFPVKIRAVIPADLKDKVVMKRSWNTKKDFSKAIAEGADKNWYMGKFREFGQFQLMIDTIPPVITPAGFVNGMNCSKLKSIRFTVVDNTEEIKNFIATLDGNWLRFSNDKGRIFVYEFDEYCAPGDHNLKITVEDQVGNITVKEYTFTR